MAISTEDQTRLLKVVIGLFNAAPGLSFLPDLESFIENGGTQEALARELAVTTIFTGTLSGTTTSAEQAAILAGNFGLTADGAAGSAATQAINFFAAGIDAGTNIGDLVYDAVMFLSNNPPAEFAVFATLLDNKAAVSAAYSATKGFGDDFGTLQAALDGVTGTAVLTQTEIDDLADDATGNPAPGNFTLTAGADLITEGEGLVFTVTASQAVTVDTDVVFTVVVDDAAAANQGSNSTNLNDFIAGTFNPVTVTILAGETTAAFGVTASNDNVTELPENYTVSAVVNGETLTKSTSLLDGQSVQTFTLTTNTDIITGTAGSDIIIGTVAQDVSDGTLGNGDQINGGAGTDALNIFSIGNVILPISITNVENIFITDETHQDVDVSIFADVTNLELDSGETLNSGEITVTLATGQSLTIDSVTDGNITVDGSNGDLDIASGASVTSVDITIDGVGAQTGLNALNDLDLDILGTGVTSVNLTSVGTNNISLANTGGAITALNISGAGALTIQGALANSIVTVDASDSSADITLTTGTGNDTITGGSGEDNFTIGTGNDIVNAGAGDDTVNVGGGLALADTFDGGDGTDTIATTVALTSALIADLSSFEKLDIAGGNNIEHNVFDFTTLESVVVGAAGISGAVTIRDMTETASVEINGSLGGDLTLIQVSAGAGSVDDTMTISIEGSENITTNSAVIAANIETVTLESLSTGTNIVHTHTEATFVNATIVTVNATTADLTISDLDAGSAITIDASGSTANVSITTGSDTFTSAFLFTGGSQNDVFNASGATVRANSIYDVSQGNDTITFEAAGVSTQIFTTATTAEDAFEVVNFITGEDKINYNGGLLNNNASAVLAASGATLDIALAANSSTTVYVVTSTTQNTALETATDAWISDKTAADALEAVVITVLGGATTTVAGLDAAIGSGESVLIVLDNDAAGISGNDTVIVRFTNLNDSGNKIDTGEIEIIGVANDAVVAAGDFM